VAYNNEKVIYAEFVDEDYIISEERADAAREAQRKKAEKTLKNESLIDKLLAKAEKLLKRIKRFGKSLGYVPTLIRMLRDWLKGEYRVSPEALIAITCGLLYLVKVVDIIPDVIPVVGYADDAAVIAGVVRIIKGELDAYIAFREGKTGGLVPEE